MRACCHKVCHVSVIPSQTFCLMSLLPGVYMRPAYAQRCTTCGLQCLPCLLSQVVLCTLTAAATFLYLRRAAGQADACKLSCSSCCGRIRQSCCSRRCRSLLNRQVTALQVVTCMPARPQLVSTSRASTPCSDSRQAIVHICKSTADSWMN